MQRKCVHQYLVSKKKLSNFCIFNRLFPESFMSMKWEWQPALTDWSITPTVQGTSPALLMLCLGKSKAYECHLQRDYNFSVWVLNIRSLACWQYCCSFLPHKLSEPRSWVRNPMKTRIHSTSQVCDSSIQDEKEVRNNVHIREFLQWKEHIRRYSNLLAIFPNLFLFVFWRFLGLVLSWCFLNIYIECYIHTTCCLCYLIRFILIWNHHSQPDWLMKPLPSVPQSKIIRSHHVLPDYNHTAPSEALTATRLLLLIPDSKDL